MRHINFLERAPVRVIFISMSAAILGACGGSDPSATTTTSSVAGGSVTLAMALGANAPANAMQPVFHTAPIDLQAPEDVDAVEPSASAHVAPHVQEVPPALSLLSTRRLTRHMIDRALRGEEVPAEALGQGSGATPFASSATAVTYTPAQIRAAYSLPLLPATGSTLTSAQAASLGAGQTIYIVDAYDDPNVAAELASFNSKFGLPQCASTAIAPTASLPLATPPPTSGCSFSKVYSGPSGGMQAAPPAYDGGWATEIALDTQWAHATAPLARIVLIESPDNGNSLLQAISLANSMGQGIVSMSFGGPEGANVTAINDGFFSVARMSYAAATGDAGAEVNWPASSTKVLAVSGTSLTFSGASARSESVWAGSGGGTSAFTPVPSYQNHNVPDMGSPTRRVVADVTFNANPYTGQYLATIAPGSTNTQWSAIGGTSLATPQWAALLAIANAERAAKSELALGDEHAVIYALSQNPATYSANFLDITQGNDGTCATCYAAVGFDAPSGLGSPNATALIAALGGSPMGAPPTVTGATVSAKTAIALSFQVSVSSKDALNYSLIGAPAGMSISNTGLVTWAYPLQGNYTVTVQAFDAITGLSGNGTYFVSVVGAQPPLVTSASTGGWVNTPLSFTMAATLDSSPLTYSVSGAPSGLSISNSGVVTWASPVAGTFTVTITAKDVKAGLSGVGTLTIVVPTAVPPSVVSQSVTAPSGTAFSVPIKMSWQGNYQALGWGLSNPQPGMTISGSNVFSWPKPVVGNYSVKITLTDWNTGLVGTGVLTLSIVAPGPTITAVALTGVAAKPLTGSITVSDPTANSVTATISGVPAGMSISTTGATIAISWKSPVTGTYQLAITAVDANGNKASATVPVTITAH